MAALTVAGVDVPVAADGQPEEAWTEIGDRGAVIDGTPEASVRTRKRTWTVKTAPLTPTAAATLRAALTSAPSVTATGDWLGGSSVTVFPVLGTETPLPTVPFTVQMQFTLAEA